MDYTGNMGTKHNFFNVKIKIKKVAIIYKCIILLNSALKLTTTKTTN